MIVETIARIRRDHFKDGKSIKAIARTRGVSRNTVRKVLRRDETAFRYDRQAPTVYPKLGPFQAQLEALLTGPPQSVAAGAADADADVGPAP